MRERFVVYAKFYGEDPKPIDEFEEGKLVDRSSVVLYIEVFIPRWDEPKADAIYYPVGKYYLSAVKHLHNTPAQNRYNSYTYQDRNFYNYRLQDGTQTKPEQSLSKTVDIPRPKTRVETEYRGGRWLKYLKAKGWVSA